MNITTQHIIKTLPFEEQFKTQLLDQLDLLSPDQKFTIEQILWDTYFALYELRLEENLELAFLRAKENKEKLDKDFYKRVEEQTEKEMQTNITQNVQEVDLTAARNAMETIVKEMKASKIKLPQ